jgi:hypothetical protein
MLAMNAAALAGVMNWPKAERLPSSKDDVTSRRAASAVSSSAA